MLGRAAIVQQLLGYTLGEGREKENGFHTVSVFVRQFASITVLLTREPFFVLRQVWSRQDYHQRQTANTIGYSTG